MKKVMLCFYVLTILLETGALSAGSGPEREGCQLTMRHKRLVTSKKANVPRSASAEVIPAKMGTYLCCGTRCWVILSASAQWVLASQSKNKTNEQTKKYAKH